MKNACLAFLSLLIFTPILYAQTPGYYLIYGNRDGSDLIVRPGLEIEVQVWGATPPGVNDSIFFMHNPLASNDTVVVSRNGGFFYFPLTEWTTAVFLNPNTYSTPGYTNQSILGIADSYEIEFNTQGDTVLIATFYMTLPNNPDYVDQTFCPFEEGYHYANGELLWGIGIPVVIPAQTFSCLYFDNYIAGDANCSGDLDGLDVIYLVNYFKGEGPPPDPIILGDANGDCSTNGLDVIYLVDYFKGTGPPPYWGDCP